MIPENIHVMSLPEAAAPHVADEPPSMHSANACSLCSCPVARHALSASR